MGFRTIPAGEPSRAPDVGSVRDKILRTARALGDLARTGGGMGPDEIEQVARELRELGRHAHDNDSPRKAPIADAVARVFADFTAAEALIAEGKAALRERLDKNDIDPDDAIMKGTAKAIALLQRSQSTMGATRLVRS